MEKRRVLTVFMLAMINVAAICNIANLSITAMHGFASLFYYTLEISSIKIYGKMRHKSFLGRSVSLDDVQICKEK